MYNRISAIVVLGLAVFTTAEPLRRGSWTQRGLARQIAPAEPTGYPAAGVTPEVPFDLPTSTAKPDATYLPPDNSPPLATDAEAQPDDVYGPPEADEIPIDQPIETDDIPEEAEIDDVAEEETKSDNEEDEPILLTVAEDGSAIAVSVARDQDEQLARLYQRFPQSRRKQTTVPERLVLRKMPEDLVLANPQNFIYMFKQENI